MTEFIRIARGNEPVSDRDALDVFEVLAYLLAVSPDDPEAADVAGRTIARMSSDSRVAAALDWWFVVTAGGAPPLALAFRLPDTIPHDLRCCMEATAELAHQGLPVPPAQWVQARRDLDRLLGSLDHDLELDSYGKSKLPGERDVWAHLQEELHPAVTALHNSSRADTFELDERAYEKEMKRSGIDENSRRWNEMVKRANECVARVNEVVRVQHLVEPWIDRVPPEPIPSIDNELAAELGFLAPIVFASVLDAAALTDPTGADTVAKVAERLEEIARDLGEADLAWLASVTDGWIAATGAVVEPLADMVRRRQELEARLDRLRGAGVDCDAAEVHLLDHDISRAEELLDELEDRRKLDRRAEALRVRLDRLRPITSEPNSPESVATSLADAERLLQTGDHTGAERVVQAAEQEIRLSRRSGLLAELVRIRDELLQLDAPATLVEELDTHLGQLEANLDRAVDESLLTHSQERLESLSKQRRREVTEKLRIANELLELSRELIEPGALAEIELAFTEVEQRLERGAIREALDRAAELGDRIDSQRVHRWSSQEGEAPLVAHIVGYCTQQLHFNSDDVRRLHVAAKTKPFVILAGLTGSGKSTIARLFAAALGADARNGRFRRVAVRPDWIDQSEVLGSIHPLRNRFEPGWLAEVARQCERNLDQIHVVLLDEMNLAPVEQYLAEYLSALEESRSGSETTMLPLYPPGAGPDNETEWPAALPFPRNLILIGTVNVDETTRVLSERVLDRANVLQLSVAISDAHHRPSDRSVRPWYVPFPEWDAICVRDPDDRHHELLVDVGEILQGMGIGVGQRAHVELERFVANARGVLSDELSLDLGVLQRIIPKVRGFKRDLLEGLNDLHETLDGTGCRLSAEVVGRWIDPSVPDDDYLDGTDARIGLLR